MTVYYLGQFPPPFGGVTVKNALLFRLLSAEMDIHKLEFRKSGSFAIGARVLLSRSGDVFLIGFGNRDLQRLFIKVIGFVRPRVLERLIVIVMGGEISGEIAQDKMYARFCQRVRAMYFETKGMAAQVEAVGLRNTRLFPNCRQRPESPWFPKSNSGMLKVVFFSLVDDSKGADLVLEAAYRTPGVEYHIYGSLSERFEEKFRNTVSGLSNVIYHGVFNAVECDVYAELHNYDVHVLPTRWRGEGVPGSLVESNIAAVPSVVSDFGFNAEIVENDVSGVVLRENTVDGLVEAIEMLDGNRTLLDSLKRGAKESAEDFFPERFLGQILSDIHKWEERGE